MLSPTLNAIDPMHYILMNLKSNFLAIIKFCLHQINIISFRVQNKLTPSIAEWCRSDQLIPCRPLLDPECGQRRVRHEGAPHPATKRHGQTSPPPSLLSRPALEVSQPLPSSATSQPAREPRQVWTSRYEYLIRNKKLIMWAVF